MRNAFVTAAAATLLLSGARVPAHSVGNEDTPLAPIEVEAQRRSIEKRVAAYIAAITPPLYADSLVRWHQDICLQVVGPPPAQIEQIAARVSVIATAAGLTVQTNPCKPNFYVVASTDPEKLLRAWSKRDHLLFGAARPRLIDEFLDTPRPVRVWYNVLPTGKPIDNGVKMPMPIAAPSTPTTMDAPISAANIVDAAANMRAIEFDVVQRFSSVIVVVDTQRIAGFKLSSVADYIAMVGLAKINLDAAYTGTPTILNLFAAGAGAGGGDSTESAPSSITAWDRDYLHALYVTRQSSRMQRAAIADMMVRDIAR